MADYSNSVIPESGQIKVEDVRDTLLGGGAVFTLPAGAVNANYTPNYFTPGAKINKWAKCKPVNNIDPFYKDNHASSASMKHPFDNINFAFYRWVGRPVLTTIKTNSGGLTYDAIEFCGMKVPCVSYNVLDEYLVMQIVEAINTYPELNWPAVPLAPYYRMGDFRGYYHKAIPGFYINASEKVYQGDGERVSGMYSENNTIGYDNDKMIGLYGTSLFENFMPVVVVKSATGSLSMYMTDSTIDSMPAFSFGVLGAGNHTLYKGLYNPYAKRFMPLPNAPQYGRDYANPVTVQVYTTGNPANNPFINGDILVGLYEISPGVDYYFNGPTPVKKMNIVPGFHTFNDYFLMSPYNSSGPRNWAIVNNDPSGTKRGAFIVMELINCRGNKDIRLRCGDFSTSLEEWDYPVGESYTNFFVLEGGKAISKNPNDMIVIERGSSITIGLHIGLHYLQYLDSLYTGKVYFLYKGSRFSKIWATGEDNSGREWNYDRDSKEDLFMYNVNTGLPATSQWDGIWSEGWMQLNIWTYTSNFGFYDVGNEVYK